jgi:hypothetical protein
MANRTGFPPSGEQVPMNVSKFQAFLEIIKNESDERHESHKNHASSRPLSEDYELIGLLGEVEFAKKTGVMLDLERKLGGDAGIDFIVPLAFSVDVKTARKPFHLIHEKGKKFADIYVLAGIDGDDVTLIGWEFGKVLEKSPAKDFGYGIINHYIPASKLKKMDELYKRMNIHD